MTIGTRRRSPVAAARALAMSLVWLAAPAAAMAGPPAIDPGARTALQTCDFDRASTAQVTRVLDAETVRLDSGVEVRLAGILSPRASDVGAEPGRWPAERNAAEALATLAEGRSTRVLYLSRLPDRYGRREAHLVIDGANGTPVWIAARMIEQGFARFAPHLTDDQCSVGLGDLEAAARRARRGLWAEAAYRVFPAWQSRAIAARRGTFQLVEGEVKAVSDKSGRAYLNFGADWRTDFTVLIRGRPRRHLAATVDLAGLTGRRVLVRGWLEWRGGPFIELTHPAQIEFVPAAEPPSPRDGARVLVPAPADAAQVPPVSVPMPPPLSPPVTHEKPPGTARHPGVYDL